MAYAEFFARRFADLVELCGVLERTYRQRCCEEVKVVFLRVFCRAFKPEPEAGKAALAALFDLFKPPDRRIKLPGLSLNFNKGDFVFRRQSRNELSLLKNAAFIFLGRVEIRIIIKHGDSEILREIFKAVAAARRTAGVKQQ